MALRASATQLRRFTRKEYERMAAQGILGPEERVELVDGEIVVMTPQGTRHTTVVNLVTSALQSVFRKGHVVRTQQPLVVDPDGEPEPDAAVVAGTHDDYLDAHPTTAVLVVEVADTSLRLDRRKARGYARAGVPEYWIVNLLDGVVEVHRGARSPSKGRSVYAESTTVMAGGVLRPLAAPKALVKVSDFLR